MPGKHEAACKLADYIDGLKLVSERSGEVYCNGEAARIIHDGRYRLVELLKAYKAYREVPADLDTTERTCGTCNTYNCPSRGTDEMGCTDLLSWSPVIHPDDVR